MSDHLTISLKQTQQPQPPPPSVPPRRKGFGRRPFVVVFALALAGLVFWGCYALYTHIAGSPTSAPAGDTQLVVQQVGKLMLLPTDEVPTIAVVSDLNKLQGQKFFANARQGDIVLMYAHASRAILFDPQLNKIIEVAPITNGQQ